MNLKENPKFLLLCLCLAAIVQGMIFTNVVLSTIERRFGWDSTQSGIIAGSYDIGSLLSVIPVTYFGGRKGASKPRWISAGLFIMGTGSLIFASPHFFSSSYTSTLNGFSNSTRADDTELCPLSDTEAKTCDTEKSGSSIHNYKYVFILGQILHGIGAASLITLGTTLMDESVSEKMAPIFISIFEASFVLGPAFGYIIGGRLLDVYTDFHYSKLEIPLQVEDPKWIGAWWLGFLFIFVLSYIIAIIMTIFPAKMRKESTENHEMQGEDTKDPNENVLATKLSYGRLQDIPQTLLGLITNLTFMGITLGATMDGFLLTGQAAFLPKYLESQFGLAASTAAMIVGGIVVPAGALGTILGGFSLKKFQLDRVGAIKLYIACQCVILPLYMGFLLNCPSTAIVGSNKPYLNENTIELTATCNANCNCDFNLGEFVCDTERRLSYLSPCHAGCQESINQTTYTQCDCLDSFEVTVQKGICKNQDCNYLYLSVMLFFQVLFTFMGTMPGLVAGLRSVDPEQRSIALGLQTLIARSLGTVPGPIFFGYIIDQSCDIWKTATCTSAARCILYDNENMSHYILAILLTWRTMALLFFLLALFFALRKH